MRWSFYELQELQDSFLQKEITTFKDEYYKEFDLIFNTFRDNGYDDVWPGVCGADASQTKNEMEKMFYKCFNTIVTRCFGWGLPKTSLIPFADCINHHNVDSTYEFFCEELHAPMKDLSDSQDKYTIDINEFIDENRKLLELDNPDVHDQEDASYYTKSKMMFDVSDFWLEKKENEDEISKKFQALKFNKKLFKEDEVEEQEKFEITEKIQADVRSEKLTNRSIHTIKKYLMREESHNVTSKNLMESS